MTLPNERLATTGPRQHGVWTGLLFGAVVICLAGAALWGGFVLGTRSLTLSLGPELVQARQALESLQRERDLLTAELSELKQQGIACERTRQIEQERDRSAQERLRAGQDERLALAKEIFSLKRLIRKGGSSAVVVQDLHLTAGEAEREFRYSFTVRQLIEDVGETSGSIDITLSGKQGDTDKALPLKKLKGSEPTRLAMRFDRSQTFEGRLVLPAGFEPQDLTVEIRPKGDKLIASAETFPWRLAE